MKKNLIRMIQLADEFFSVKNDPSQLAIDEEVMARLQLIHPRTLSEESTEDGPVAWMLVIPTTRSAMEEFVAGWMNERELLNATPPGIAYQAIYLCSALVLPEYRGKGTANRLLLEAVKAIRLDHPIEAVYYWAFSDAGKHLAESIARECGLPLFERLAH
jgi:GNAT superfamily N-acetyltransferase